MIPLRWLSRHFTLNFTLDSQKLVKTLPKLWNWLLNSSALKLMKLVTYLYLGSLHILADYKNRKHLFSTLGWHICASRYISLTASSSLIVYPIHSVNGPRMWEWGGEGGWSLAFSSADIKKSTFWRYNTYMCDYLPVYTYEKCQKVTQVYKILCSRY